MMNLPDRTHRGHQPLAGHFTIYALAAKYVPGAAANTRAYL
jgi:hypothetical protein